MLYQHKYLFSTPLPSKATYDENVDSTPHSDHDKIWFVPKETEGTTYLTGVGHDVGEVLRHVHRLGAVRAVVRDFRVIGIMNGKLLLSTICRWNVLI